MDVMTLETYGLIFLKNANEKFDESECISQWDRMVKKDYSIGSLTTFCIHG